MRDVPNLWPALYDWANGTGMDTSDFGVTVGPSDVAPGELGVFAKQKLEPGDILVWAPTSLLLNKDKAVAMWGDSVADMTDHMCIMLLLIHERCVRGEASNWSTYWGALPSFSRDVAGPSFLWEEEEWEGLQGSDGYAASIQMYNNIVDMVNDIEPLVKERPEDFPPSAFTEENIFWAAGVVTSRAYGDDETGKHLAIAPLVDFLNHRAGALQLTRFGNGIVAYAHKHFDEGDEVWVSYGGKNNAQLLSQYGFVDDDNMEEAVFLRMGEHLLLTEPHLEAKRALLAELLDDEGREPEAAIFRLARRPREWQAKLLPAIRILALGEEDTPPESARDLAPTQAPRLEAAAWNVLRDAISRRDTEYPGTLKENKEQLASGGLSGRQSLGLRLRVSERELLALSGVHCMEQADLAEKAMQAA